MFARENELPMVNINEDILINELTQGTNLPVDNMDLVSQVTNTPGTRIASACILRADGNFFLIVELNLGTTIGTELTRVVVIRISADVAARLLAAGVDLCTVQTTVPTTTTGRGLSAECTFVIGNTAYIIFIVPNRTDRIVVVTSPLCTVL